ncbi:MAG TPA: galactose oxidase-like domain-containing protein [Candidatus Eisenbacteria bacterium]|nr:galactose oxidase-like domain-containing protein [Candidatus Eisenbacteria bacterium]
MVVYGGRSTAGNYLADTWVLQYSQQEGAEPYLYSWELISGGPGDRYGHVAVSGWSDNSMIVFGGRDNGQIVSNKVYRFRPFGSSWTWDPELDQSGVSPGPRWQHAVAWDDFNQRMILFGGRSQFGIADDYVYDLKVAGNTATWRRLTTLGTGPGPREGHTIVWDTESYSRTGLGSGWQRLILFGGKDAAGARKNDAWILWFNNDQTTMTWESVPGCPTNCPPSARTRHAAFWDFTRLSMVVVGGDAGEPNSSNELWELRTPVYGSSALNWSAAPDFIPDPGPGLAGQTVVRTNFEIVAQPELFDPQTGQYSDAFSRKIQQPYYPQMFVLPSGNLLYPAINNYTFVLNPTSGVWSIIGATGDRDFLGDAAAMYRPGKVVKAGYDGIVSPDKKTARLEVNGLDQTAGWVQGQDMQASRMHHNLTILPNGKVIVTGGHSQQPEIWDPDQDPSSWWSSYPNLAPNPAIRDYHSTALLLPDGRILTAGGQGTGDETLKATIFCPPYLFDPNGRLVDDQAVQAAYKRPEIAGLPCRVNYAAEFEVRSPQALDVATAGKAALIRPGAVTHGFDENQRYVPLAITDCPSGNRLRVTAPANGNLAPPGDYLLFLVSSVGVPSIAQWIRLGTASAPLNSVPWNCNDVTSPAIPSGVTVDLISDTQIWLYWTAPGDDGTAGGVVTEYDLRASTLQPIYDNGSLCAGYPRGVVPAEPGPLSGPNLLQDGKLTGLWPCTQYRVAVKARDEKDNWGPISTEKLTGTMCGGGGGEEFSARSLNPGTSALRQAQAFGSDRIATGSCMIEFMPAGETLRLQVVSLSDEQASAIFGDDSCGILVQEPATQGWRTTARRFAAPTNTGFGLRGFGRPARYFFRGGNAFQQALGTVASGASGEVFRVTAARHSRLGDQTGVMQASDETTLPVVGGDTLSVTYAKGPGSPDDAGDWFVLVGPTASAARTSRHRPSTERAVPGALAEFALEAGEPNPFAGTTTIHFSLAQTEQVRLEVFDLLGRRMEVLADSSYPAGRHAAVWNAREQKHAPAGIYLCRLTAGEFRAQRTLVKLP